MKPFIPCLAPHPTRDSECLNRQGHGGNHEFEEWPDGFQVGVPRLVSWAASSTATTFEPVEEESE